MKKKKVRTNKKIRAAALELLRDPNFLFLVGQQLSAAGVVGEAQNLLILYLACLTGSLEHEVSVLVKGPSSTGKSNLMKAVLPLVPPEKVLTRSSFTGKALAYASEELAGKILYLVEHRGGKDGAFFRRLLQSEGAIHHEATTGSGHSRGTKVTTRIGAPVILCTTTDERVYDDDETRFLSIRADESAEQSRQVFRDQFSKKRRETI